MKTYKVIARHVAQGRKVQLGEDKTKEEAMQCAYVTRLVKH